MFEKYMTQAFLNDALRSLEELSLYTKGGSSDATENIRVLVSNIGEEGERMMLKNGILFTPKYLKETQSIQ
jgi:hypothetical protein